ncbi:MAG TPA: DUF4476 domain-containing protein [Kofleriaceae bacterium]|nr:DUF4476 domain-containing protein [Kofleriaceae bacterium]
MLALRTAAHADAKSDRAIVAEAIDRLSAASAQLAKAANASDARTVRRKLAPAASDLADDLANLARRTRRDTAYDALAKDSIAIGRDASALVDLADEADDKDERKALRAQATALDQGVAIVRKTLEALAARRDDSAAPAKPAPMKKETFDQLVGAIRAESFEDGKLGVVRHAVASSWFTAAQVATVMGLFSFDDNKVEAAATMWPKVVDRENSFVLFQQLSFDSSKEALRKRIAR